MYAIDRNGEIEFEQTLLSSASRDNGIKTEVVVVVATGPSKIFSF